MCHQPTLRPNAIVAFHACERDDAVVIMIHGELDASTRQVVQDHFASLTVASRGSVVIDASGVTFIDCAGWDSIMQAARDVGREVWLTAPAKPVLRLLELLTLPAADHEFGPSAELRLA